ncbi:MAG TPA: hypothetical protein VG796_02985 [Verrucomicrobiales bacterium]|jgi:predicted RNase H-like HicB family nuclease|nr:hypothetical protein [Verrucomicrobiales bacterium]
METSPQFTLTAEIYREGEWFAAFCPEVPEANGQGATETEAVQSLWSAVALVFQDRREEARERARATPPLKITELAHA